MDSRPEWNFAAVGNIVRTRIDENGNLCHGTKEFSGGTKVYLCGKYWRKHDKTIKVIGLGRCKYYRIAEIPVEYIDNVRLQSVYRPEVVELMDNWEFYDYWWHRTGEEKRDVKRFIEKWEEAKRVSEERPNISLEEIIKEEGCNREERVDYDFNAVFDADTNCPDELKSKLANMQLVGRVISDFRFISHIYNMTEDGIGERLWMETEGYPKELHDYVSYPENVDDNFPYPLFLEMDEPLLIRFEDGDQFEIFTMIEERFYVGMNQIPWNAKSKINQENVNGSILFESLKGAVITGVDVITKTNAAGEDYIDSVRIGWEKDLRYSIVIASEYHDYMTVSIEDYPDRILKCPFSQVKKSLYKD